MTIHIAGIAFEGPFPISSWKPKPQAAVYCILKQPFLPGGNWTVVYVGETENLSERVTPSSHHKFNCWRSQCRSEGGIFIAMHKMASSTKTQRCNLENKIKRTYDPPCND